MPSPTTEQIRDVWNYNLDEEFSKMRETLEKYPYIAMDTEFPGWLRDQSVNSKVHLTINTNF